MPLITGEKTTKEKRLMRNYWIMFGFGITFTILMTVQGLLLPKEAFYFLEVVELVGVYFIIKQFTKKEIGGKIKK